MLLMILMEQKLLERFMKKTFELKNNKKKR